MVKDMRSRMSLFSAILVHQASKEGRTKMLIGDMDFSRFMIYVQHVEEENLKDREEFKNKWNKRGMSPGNRRVMPNNHPYYLLVHFNLRAKVITMVRIPELNLHIHRYGHTGHFMRECPKNKQVNGNGGNKTQSSSVALQDRAALRGSTFGNGGGANHLYVVNNCEE
ncbi:uncharacterized protein LOC107019604 [Solanum pennellii]|uniref:Uncharacterized protein LOC107019604 n=1 Tax=Solanum pennellii TaxID=28526 RepID=A0ABM1GSY1_SOLPN|nr:uncharacterized protein LOC107019604 [Solanum pennellii]